MEPQKHVLIQTFIDREEERAPGQENAERSDFPFAAPSNVGKTTLAVSAALA